MSAYVVGIALALFVFGVFAIINKLIFKPRKSKKKQDDEEASSDTKEIE